MIELPDFDFDLKFRPYTLGGAQFWADIFWRSGWRIQRHATNDHYRLLNPKNRRMEQGSRDACFAELAAQQPPENPEHLVIMVHGLLATWRFMQPFAKAFKRYSLECALINYPSTRADLATHGRHLAELVAGLEGVKTIDAVTHSMGGLVLSNAYVQSAWPKGAPTLRKAVMLGPPLKGAAMARLLAQVKLLHPIVGPPLTFLQAPKGAPELPEDVELLIIAGARGNPSGFNPLLDGDDDGTVAVRETRPKRPHLFRTVFAQHTWMRYSHSAQEMTARFLKGELSN